MNRWLLRKEFLRLRWHLLAGFFFLSVSALLIPYSFRQYFPFLAFSFQEYVYGNWWGQALWQMSFVFALILGVGFYEQEKKQGTMDFLQTRGLARKELLYSWLAVNILLILTVIVCSTAVLLIAIRYSGIVTFLDHSVVSATIFCFTAALVPFSLAFFISLRWTRLLAVGVVLGWILVDIIAIYPLYPKLSLLYYLTSAELFSSTWIPPVAPLLIILAVFCTLVCAAAKHFYKQDL